MSIDDVISQCGGVLVENPVVIVGGPMMGYIEKDLNTPITKTMTD
jgi:Na+-translocating ferredoxin:NAD+ oxidoreductase RnfC subunit